LHHLVGVPESTSNHSKHKGKSLVMRKPIEIPWQVIENSFHLRQHIKVLENVHKSPWKFLDFFLNLFIFNDLV